MKTLAVIFLLVTCNQAQSQSLSIDSLLFDYSGLRKPCPYKNCYPDTTRLDEVWAEVEPELWLVNDNGDSISVGDMRKSLPNLAKYGIIAVSIDWDGFIWKARLISKDTTDYYLVDIPEIARQARGRPTILFGGTPRVVDIAIPLWRKSN